MSCCGYHRYIYLYKDYITDMLSLALSSLLMLACVYILVNILLPDKPPRQGIYSSTGGRWYSFKWILMYLVLKLRRRQGAKQNQLGHSTQKGATDGVTRGYGVSSHESGEEMEHYADLGDDPQDNNCVYLYGINPEDGTWIDVRIAKRPGDVREVWFFIRVPGLQCDLLLPAHPATMISGVKSDGYEGAGLNIEVNEPMKTWDIAYKGNCRMESNESENSDGDSELAHVTCTLRWKARTPYVNFDTDISPKLMATNIAREKWTGEFFDNIKRLHQTHYEQFGQLEGTVIVEGHPEQHVTGMGVRDRSFGPRNWNDFFSYCLLFATFEDGSSLHAGAFCFTNTFTHLQSGFLIDSKGNLQKAVSSSLSLPDLLPDTTPPKTFTFDMRMDKGTTYSFTVQHESTTLFCPDDNHQDIQIHEIKSTFTRDGIQGYGISEWLTKSK